MEEDIENYAPCFVGHPVGSIVGHPVGSISPISKMIEINVGYKISDYNLSINYKVVISVCLSVCLFFRS